MTMVEGVIASKQLTSLVVPNALGDKAWQLWVLGILYLLAAMYSVFEFVRDTDFRLRITSFRVLFFGILFGLMVERSILALFPFEPWNLSTLIFVDVMIPLFLQFAVFSLVVVFLTYCLFVLHRQSHLVMSRLLIPYAFLLIVILLIAGICSAVAPTRWAKSNQPKDQMELFDFIWIYSSLVAGLLFLMFAAYGYRVHRDLLMSVSGIGDTRSKVYKFMLVIAVYFFTFLVRAIWGLSYLIGLNPLHHAIGDWQGDVHDWQGFNTDRYYWSYLLFFITAEIFPTVVIMLFPRILPSSEGGRPPPSRGGGGGAIGPAFTPIGSQDEHYSTRTAGGPRDDYTKHYGQHDIDDEILH